ncbi:MAG: hypothetical protein LBF87_01635 [Treponema sp.]|jgi:hypothetical protein|nr:hypothetical protein [Treponema sp.]
MKRKRLLCLALVFGMAGAVSAQTASKVFVLDWVHGFFLDIGVLGNYENVESSNGLRIENGFLLFEIGGGYDFGRITARLYGNFGLPIDGIAYSSSRASYGNFGLPIDGIAYSSDRASYVKDVMDVSNTKFGIEGAFKIIDTSRFDVLLPLGVVFSTTEYTQKTPSYTSSGSTSDSRIYAYDRIWLYEYTSIVSGLYFTVQMSNHLKFCVLSSIGLPLVRSFTYKQILQKDNVVWENTGSDTYSVKSNVDIFTFSAGLGLRVNF